MPGAARLGPNTPSMPREHPRPADPRLEHLRAHLGAVEHDEVGALAGRDAAAFALLPARVGGATRVRREPVVERHRLLGLELQSGVGLPGETVRGAPEWGWRRARIVAGARQGHARFRETGERQPVVMVEGHAAGT